MTNINTVGTAALLNPTEPDSTHQRVVRDIPKIFEDVPVKAKIKPAPIIEKPQAETIIEKPAPEPVVEKPIIEEPALTEPEKAKVKPVYEDNFLSGYGSQIVESSPSKIGFIIPVLLWLTAFAAVAFFAYSSNQKTAAFDRQILEDAQSFSSQKNQLKFPEANLPTRKNQSIVEGNISGKVLPVNRQNNELHELFYDLPDDLRPANIDEAKTLMWINCKAEPAGRLADGSPGYQEKCNTYLVDRQSSKLIGVEEFLGISPALSQNQGNGSETGKVPKERYISYLREKQPEADRSAMKYPSDSPNHHYLTKSEFIYAIVLLCVLGAIGLGWTAYKMKSAWTNN